MPTFHPPATFVTPNDHPAGLSTIRSRSHVVLASGEAADDIDVENPDEFQSPGVRDPRGSGPTHLPPEAKSTGAAYAQYQSKGSVAWTPLGNDRRGSVGMTHQSQRSKNSVREAITSPFDVWRTHQTRLTVCMAAGSVLGIALTIITYMAADLTVPNDAWFNGLHVLIGLLCTAIAHYADLVVVFASRAYAGFSLLGEDGISLRNVEQAVSGGAISSLKCLIGDRVRLIRLGEHATIGRRPSGLLPAAVTAILIAICMPVLHVIIVLGSKFEREDSAIGGFLCDNADYAVALPVHFDQLIRGTDYFLADTPTASLSTPDNDIAYVAACYNVQGHPDISEFSVKQTVQSLRVNVNCQDAVPNGSVYYRGTTPAVAGSTDFLITRTSGSCSMGFCILTATLLGYGPNSTVTNCTIETQNVAIEGEATFSRVGVANYCDRFIANPDSVTAPDPFYTNMWASSINSFSQAVGRWPTGMWAGGIAYELPRSNFTGYVDPEQSIHMLHRLMGGLHHLLAGTYAPTTFRECDGMGDTGAGTILMPKVAQVLGTMFGVASLLLAGFTWSAERSIQLMVGRRNHGRAVSALDSPLRFAALLDRSKAMDALSGMCDDTPERVAKAAEDVMVLLGGDADVSGTTGHACLSTVDQVDSFSAVRTYRGRREPTYRVRRGTTARYARGTMVRGYRLNMHGLNSCIEG
ncbi:hypothetical protein HKX48_008814 [Thoreauomyces humboldtii]|nr:hypothetical protein HKX48_008814 [Thoreauomyces humboldtii]